MKYIKPALTYEQQADQLLARGLHAERSELISRLQAVSYYRLSTYWFPFRNSDNTFQPGTTLEIIWRRYAFDRQLRLLVLDAIERVEVAIRTDLVFQHAHQFGPFGYLASSSLPNLPPAKHQELLDKINGEYRRSQESFVQHFKTKYGDRHSALPLWMVTELLTFGTLLTMFRGLPKSMKQTLAQRYGIADEVLESWLTALNGIRNVCAHHARLWDRGIGYKPKIPHERKHPQWHKPVLVPANRIFGILTILKYCLNRVAPQSQWSIRLVELLGKYPDIPSAPMGFAENWHTCGIWN
jgi:abortive infection bacteriophage resistance protein